MIRFEDIYDTVKGHHPEADLEGLRKAYIFSAVEHKGQTRASGEPYLVHPLEVAAILAEMRMDPACVIVGLLHDVLEDTLTEPERIKEYFGADVLHIVEGVTKISKIPFSSSEERQAENFRKLLLAMVDDIRVILVKLADRLHNMRTLQYLAEDRRQKIARETMDIYAPLAGRLGMSKIKNELEDLSFQYLEPEAYKDLTTRVEERRKTATALIEKLKEIVSAKMKAAGIEVVLDGRIKRLYSIHQKLRRQRIQLDQVYDFVAVRILVGSVPDCYAALGVIHNLWRPVPGRIKDFIAMPRPNGYQSLHTSVISERGVPFEVQIRTVTMHRMAEEGIAAHWKYKEGRVGDHRDERHFQWMRQLLEYQQEVRDPQEFIQNLKVDLYPEEVYTFTPKGLVKAFPRGATPIDFAYSIHTDVGHRCVGARVNGKMVPLRTHLRSGDIVEIITAAGHKPSRDWLSFVVTSHARYEIKYLIRSEERVRAIELGRKVLDDPASAKLLAELSLQKIEDVYALVGYGKLGPKQVLLKLVPGESLQEKPPVGPVTAAVRRAFGSGEEKIKVRGVDDLMVFRARCCNPIRGEKIVGYITRGKGVSVHSATCPNVVNLLYDPERRIEVEWDKGETGDAAAPYTVKLTMEVRDRKGLLAAVSAKIADINTNIRNMEAHTDDDRRARIDVTVEISDVKHLERVMKSLRGVDGVVDVERATK